MSENVAQQDTARICSIKNFSTLTDSALAYAIASVLVFSLPLGSFVSVFLAIKAKKLVKDAEQIALKTGISEGWETLVPYVIGQVGFYRGIVFSALYAYSFFKKAVSFIFVFLIILFVFLFAIFAQL